MGLLVIMLDGYKGKNIWDLIRFFLICSGIVYFFLFFVFNFLGEDPSVLDFLHDPYYNVNIDLF